MVHASSGSVNYTCELPFTLFVPIPDLNVSMCEQQAFSVPSVGCFFFFFKAGKSLSSTHFNSFAYLPKCDEIKENRVHMK